ncbi:DUF998 domain-containing protein [Streptomyces xiamenensis]|uniref:ABC transport protein n=1 Tax=Streptomyces xiamenensis TaxID=408015 RepID=A0A0F7G1R0_9ACTN|nr:DUF998 domain-containing protein [Streptomyces xiamenensis]AKG46778.1 ABC transport protein [Streptomyces xiamenensis]
MRGYPPGTAEGTPAHTSTAHQRHDGAGPAVFGPLPLAVIIAVFVVPGTGWKAYSVLTALVVLVGAGLFARAWEDDHPRTGLVQRVVIVTGWLWLGCLFAHAA